MYVCFQHVLTRHEVRTELFHNKVAKNSDIHSKSLNTVQLYS
jgi:hypothetical protein